MTSMIKKLSIALVVGVIAAVGFVTPANAAAATVSTTSFTAGAGNAAGLSFSTGPVTTSAVSSLDVKIYNNSNQSQTFSPAAAGCTTFATCKINSVKFGSVTLTQEGVAVSGKSVSVLGTQGVVNQNQSHIAFTFSGTGLFLSSEAVEVIFDAGALTAPNANGNYTFSGSLSSASFVDYTAAVTVSGASSMVSFNANGGTGTMTAQVANTTTALNANTFTKAGYTFAGWATSQPNADAGIVAYADGANYSFVSSVTLRAVWTAGGSNNSSSSSSSNTLANTGVNTATGVSLLIGGVSLALVGAELLLIARRKRSN